MGTCSGPFYKLCWVIVKRKQAKEGKKPILPFQQDLIMYNPPESNIWSELQILSLLFF